MILYEPVLCFAQAFANATLMVADLTLDFTARGPASDHTPNKRCSSLEHQAFRVFFIGFLCMFFTVATGTDMSQRRCSSFQTVVRLKLRIFVCYFVFAVLTD